MVKVILVGLLVPLVPLALGFARDYIREALERRRKRRTEDS